jgi:hypothetical protein
MKNQYQQTEESIKMENNSISNQDEHILLLPCGKSSMTFTHEVKDLQFFPNYDKDAFDFYINDYNDASHEIEIKSVRDKLFNGALTQSQIDELLGTNKTKTEVLSQDEIDQLLTAMQPEDEVDTKPYDFRYANKVSKEAKRCIDILHQKFAAKVCAEFARKMPFRMELEVVSVDELTYEEAMRSYPSQEIFFIFTMRQNHKTSLSFIGIDLSIIGTYNEDIILIVQKYLRPTVKRALKILAKEWQKYGRFRFHIKGAETNQEFISIVPPDAKCILVSIDLQCFGNEGVLSVLYPYHAIQSAIEKMDHGGCGGPSPQGGLDEN